MDLATALMWLVLAVTAGVVLNIVLAVIVIGIWVWYIVKMRGK
jgi:hypothetical protein